MHYNYKIWEIPLYYEIHFIQKFIIFLPYIAYNYFSFLANTFVSISVYI